MYFITFSVVGWVDVFTKLLYRTILLDSLRYCQKEKGLIIYAWCLMSNHIHMIIDAERNNISDILRDFKQFTSRQILLAIQNNSEERRKKWMLKIFSEAGEHNSRNSKYQFWQQDNHPIELFGERFIIQKLDYIHENPVKAAIVDREEDYLYSSARDYYSGKNCGLIRIKFL